MRRFSSRRLRGAVVSVALTMCVVLSACGGKTSGTGTSDFTPTAHDFVLIRQLLAARAKAVVDGSQTAFMKSVDPDNSSFRASELVEYQNLQQLPVAPSSYESGTAGLPPPQSRATTRPRRPRSPSTSSWRAPTRSRRGRSST